MDDVGNKPGTQTELWLSVGGSSVSVCLVRLVTTVSFITVNKAQCPMVSVCHRHWFLVLLIQWKPVSTSEQKSKNIIPTLSHSWEFISRDCNFISCYLTFYFTITTLFLLIRTEYLVVTAISQCDFRQEGGVWVTCKMTITVCEMFRDRLIRDWIWIQCKV